jgi:hypothetical protein
MRLARTPRIARRNSSIRLRHTGILLNVVPRQEASVDSGIAWCDNYRIMGIQARSPITALLQETIIQSAVPYKTLERETGVKRSSIQRFIDGRQSIRLDMADRLAAYFGFELRLKQVKSDGTVAKL